MADLTSVSVLVMRPLYPGLLGSATEMFMLYRDTKRLKWSSIEATPASQGHGLGIVQ